MPSPQARTHPKGTGRKLKQHRIIPSPNQPVETRLIASLQPMGWGQSPRGVKTHRDAIIASLQPLAIIHNPSTINRHPTPHHPHETLQSHFLFLPNTAIPTRQKPGGKARGRKAHCETGHIGLRLSPNHVAKQAISQRDSAYIATRFDPYRNTLVINALRSAIYYIQKQSQKLRGIKKVRQRLAHLSRKP